MRNRINQAIAQRLFCVGDCISALDGQGIEVSGIETQVDSSPVVHIRPRPGMPLHGALRRMRYSAAGCEIERVAVVEHCQVLWTERRAG